MSTSGGFAEITKDNVKLLLENEFWGLYNMVCNGITGRHEVTLELLKVLKLENTIKSIKKTTKKGGFLKWDSLTKKALSLEGEIMAAERAKIDIYPFANDTVRKQVPQKEISELVEDENKNPRKKKELTEIEKRTQIELARGDELSHYEDEKALLDEKNRIHCPGK